AKPRVVRRGDAPDRVPRSGWFGGVASRSARGTRRARRVRGGDVPAARMAGRGLRGILPRVHADPRAGAAPAGISAGRPARGGERRYRGTARDPLGLLVDAEPLPAPGLVRLRNRVRGARADGRAPAPAPAAVPRLAVLPGADREPRDDACEVEPRDR